MDIRARVRARVRSARDTICLHRSWIRALFICILDMAAFLDLTLALRQLNEPAHFNKWCVLEVVAAEPESVAIAMPWLSEVA